MGVIRPFLTEIWTIEILHFFWKNKLKTWKSSRPEAVKEIVLIKYVLYPATSIYILNFSFVFSQSIKLRIHTGDKPL